MSIDISFRDRMVDSGSPPAYQVVCGNRTISLFGEVKYVVDYQNLSLRPTREEEVLDILDRWGSAGDLRSVAHILTELFGCYVVLAQEGGAATYLCTGTEITTPVYYGCQGNEVYVNTSWVDILRRFERIELNIPALCEMASRDYVAGHNTLFDNLRILKHYGVYAVHPDRLELLQHTFPGLHTEQTEYTLDDYLEALACYKPYHSSIGLAYSGGTDSRVLTYVYRDELKELLTITQTEPYISDERLLERQSALRLAHDKGLRFTDVVVNYEEVPTFRPYYEKFVLCSPFSSFLAVHYFHLSSMAQSEAVMTGQSGDAVWDWGFHQIYFSPRRSHSTSSHAIMSDIKSLYESRNFRSIGGRIVSRYLSRYAMIHSYKGLRLERFIRKRRTYGPEYNVLRAYPYKMFSLERAISRGSLGGAMSWARGAEAAGKTPLLPYLTPLALHVSSQIPRRHYFDLKAPLRQIYVEYDSSVIEQELDLSEAHHKKPYVSSLFDLSDSQIEYIQQFLDQHAASGVRLEEMSHGRNRHKMHLTHWYYLFCYVNEQLELV